MTKPKPKLRIGDLFTMPLDEERIVVGQIVATFLSSYYFAIFEPTFQRGDDIDLDTVPLTRVAFLASSFDAKLRSADWVLIGNRSVAEEIPLPAYQFGTPGRTVIEDCSGTRRRPAQGDEAQCVPHRETVSPSVLEKALRAGHGLHPWNDAFASLIPPLDSTAARLFGRTLDSPATPER